MTWEEAVIWLKAQPEHADLVRACFYDLPLLGAAERYYASSEWHAVRALLPLLSGRALDLGAGMGISSYALAKDGWNVTALEPDPSNVVGFGAIRQLTRDACLSVEVVQDWGESLPFSTGSFDLVHARQVLHHARNLKMLCAEVERVLKPGGLFIATREHVISRREDLHVFLERHPLHHLYGGENAFRLADYLAAMSNARLELDRVFNPWASDINLFPETKSSLKRRLAGRFHWPWPGLIPDRLLEWRGSRMTAPGRLYSFFCHKPNCIA